MTNPGEKYNVPTTLQLVTMADVAAAYWLFKTHALHENKDARK